MAGRGMRQAGLRVIEGGGEGATGENVLRDWMRFSAEYITLRLPEVPADDPLRDELQALALRQTALVGPEAVRWPEG